MIWSVVTSLADKALRRPTWLEQDGAHRVLVRGYSPIDNLVFGAIAAAVILLPVILFLVTHP